METNNEETPIPGISQDALDVIKTVAALHSQWETPPMPEMLVDYYLPPEPKSRLKWRTPPKKESDTP